jgi:hypothetical protein
MWGSVGACRSKLAAAAFDVTDVTGAPGSFGDKDASPALRANRGEIAVRKLVVVLFAIAFLFTPLAGPPPVALLAHISIDSIGLTQLDRPSPQHVRAVPLWAPG